MSPRPAQLNNITMELMSGRAEDNGNDVADIISEKWPRQPPVLSHYSQLSTVPKAPATTSATNFILRSVPSLRMERQCLKPLQTPPGDYHVRMNGTIWSGITTLSTTTARSNTFNVNTSTSYPCNTPPWTPVRSVTDPGYSPLRITDPVGGDVEYQTNLNDGQLSSLSVEFTVVDAFFDILKDGDVQATNMAMTMEFIRSNFTSTSPHNPGSFVAFSDEFYVALEAPCAGLTVNNSTSATSSASPGPSAGSGGANSSKKNGGGRMRAVPLVSWSLGACMLTSALGII
ncbi:hypothetical protein B0H17DRAFT_1147254 [Mycena rosella]|uniref:Uncharacterized protein n=1 Tax=Mycena rosella TaxID=1033263 RepID=A0AAD7G3Z7_MYCRO|nr:hypothetical protein B0H17DRAFT_1147254 [Mycena rosella]